MAENFGYNDMMRMQSEAVQRVKEMQRRAQNAVQRTNVQRAGRVQDNLQNKGETFRSSTPPIHQNAKSTALPLDYISNQPSPPAQEPTPPPISHGKEEPSVTKSTNDKNHVLHDNLDRLLVVALILLLSQEEADELLLMALGYLIM